MPAERIHLVRHGEVHNPAGVLYGRLDGFPLSERGRRMADASARWLASNASVSRVVSSPLIRARESAQPIAEAFGTDVTIRDGLIEASSKLEGGRFQMNLGILAKPAAWRYLVNPLRPSWGEPFVDVARRMMSELEVARESVDGGDVVLVSHQLPIWMVHRRLRGKPLFHDPRARRCALSSITTVGWDDGFVELGYVEPAALSGSMDSGAV